MSIRSSKFLPENLRDYEFYTKLTEVLDWIIQQYHEKNIDALRALYDIKAEEFDYKRILNLLGANYFLPWNVDSTQFKIICALLSNIYEIKGTNRGLRYLLRLIGLDANVFEWYYINDEYHKGNPKWTHEVPKCSIVLELAFGSNPIGICNETSRWAIPKHSPETPEEQQLPPGTAFEDTEGKFAEFAKYLLWICTKLEEIRWTKIFEEYVTTTEQLEHQLNHWAYNKYSNYKFNCPDTIVMGGPVFRNYPLIGSPGFKVGDIIWQGQSFYISSFDSYNQINYDGVEEYGFIGKSEEVNSPYNIGSGPKIGVSQERNEYGQLIYYFVGYKSETVWIEPGTPVISGCSPSRLYEWKEMWFEGTAFISPGTLITPERIIGTGYIISDRGIDDLVITPMMYAVETVDFQASVEVLKEVAAENDIHEIIGWNVIGHGEIQPEFRYIAQDYFENYINFDKVFTVPEEQFYLNCLQIGGRGNAYQTYTDPDLLIGGPVIGGGISVGPQHHTEHQGLSHPYNIGEYFLIGYGFTIGCPEVIGGGSNFLGDCSPYNVGNIARANNLIVDWMSEDWVAEYFEDVEHVDLDLEVETDIDFNSRAIKEIFYSVIGGTQIIGSETHYYIGSQIFDKIGKETFDKIGEFVVGDGRQINQSHIFTDAIGEGRTINDSRQYFTTSIGDGKTINQVEEAATLYLGDQHSTFEILTETNEIVCRFVSDVPMLGQVFFGSSYSQRIGDDSNIGNLTGPYTTITESVVYDSLGNFLIGSGRNIDQAETTVTSVTVDNEAIGSGLIGVETASPGCSVIGVSPAGMTLSPGDRSYYGIFTNSVIQSFSNEVEFVDDLEEVLSASAESNIIKSLFGDLIGGTQFIGGGTQYAIGSEVFDKIGSFSIGDRLINQATETSDTFIGDGKTVGQYITPPVFFVGDNHSELTVSDAGEEFSDRFIPEAPVIGYVLVGTSNIQRLGDGGDLGSNLIGFESVNPGCSVIGVSPYGVTVTDKDRIYFSLFETVQIQSFSNDVESVDMFEDIWVLYRDPGQHLQIFVPRPNRGTQVIGSETYDLIGSEVFDKIGSFSIGDRLINQATETSALVLGDGSNIGQQHESSGINIGNQHEIFEFTAETDEFVSTVTTVSDITVLTPVEISEDLVENVDDYGDEINPEVPVDYIRANFFNIIGQGDNTPYTAKIGFSGFDLGAGHIGPEYLPVYQVIGGDAVIGQGQQELDHTDYSVDGSFEEQFVLNDNTYFELLNGSGPIILDQPGTPDPLFIDVEGYPGTYVWDPADNPLQRIGSSFGYTIDES